jgi:hypothetical protein
VVDVGCARGRVEDDVVFAFGRRAAFLGADDF